jgi:hypothetical protein
MGGAQSRGEPLEALWVELRCKWGPPPPMTVGDYGGNRQCYRIQWLERPALGPGRKPAWSKAWRE